MVAAPKTTFDIAAAEYIKWAAHNHKPKRMTQKALGQAAGIPDQTMGRYWRGEVSMTLGTLVKLIDALGEKRAEAFEQIDRFQVALEKPEG